MAKKSKGGYRSDDADDDTGEDRLETRATSPQPQGSPGDEEYEVVVPGTIIDGVYYPRPVSEDVSEDDTMIVLLDASKAQALANSGVQLKKDGEPVAPDAPEVKAAAETDAEAEERSRNRE